MFNASPQVLNSIVVTLLSPTAPMVCECGVNGMNDALTLTMMTMLGIQLVFDTADGKKFGKASTAILVFGGVGFGIFVLWTAVSHQQRKHGESPWR